MVPPVPPPQWQHAWLAVKPKFFEPFPSFLQLLGFPAYLNPANDKNACKKFKISCQMRFHVKCGRNERVRRPILHNFELFFPGKNQKFESLLPKIWFFPWGAFISSFYHSFSDCFLYVSIKDYHSVIFFSRTIMNLWFLVYFALLTGFEKKCENFWNFLLNIDQKFSCFPSIISCSTTFFRYFV